MDDRIKYELLSLVGLIVVLLTEIVKTVTSMAITGLPGVAFTVLLFLGGAMWGYYSRREMEAME